MILVFGSINVDTIYQLPSLPRAGETVIGRAATVQPGGKGANQAVAAARDGASVAMVGAVGRDPAASIALAGLAAAGVDLTRVSEVDGITGSAAICVDPQGENQIAVASGANWQVVADQVAAADIGRETTVVLQMEVPAMQSALLIRRARASGARIILNLAPAAPMPRDALAMVDWLVVNEAEAEWLDAELGMTPEALGIGVVRTLGARGVAAMYGSERWTISASPVTVVDAAGAGDCFTGVFAAALDRGEGVPAALGRANVAAGLTCTRSGCQRSIPLAAETDGAMRPG